MSRTSQNPVVAILVRDALAAVQEYKLGKDLVELHESKVIAAKHRLDALIQKITELQQVDELGAGAEEEPVKKAEGGVRVAIREVLKGAPQRGFRAREIANALEGQGFKYSSRVPLASRVANELKKMSPMQVKKIGTAYVLADQSQQRRTD